MPHKIQILFYIKNNQSNTLKYTNYINLLILIINLGSKWSGRMEWVKNRQLLKLGPIPLGVDLQKGEHVVDDEGEPGHEAAAVLGVRLLLEGRVLVAHAGRHRQPDRGVVAAACMKGGRNNLGTNELGIDSENSTRFDSFHP